MAGHPTPSAELLERERQALDLRRAGITYDVIASRLGYTNRSAAKKAVMRGIARTLQESADELRTVEADRLDRMQAAAWTGAMRGDDKALVTVLKIMERRARLLGLDAPTSLEHAGPGGDPLTIEILAALVPTMTTTP